MAFEDMDRKMAVRVLETRMARIKEEFKSLPLAEKFRLVADFVEEPGTLGTALQMAKYAVRRLEEEVAAEKTATVQLSLSREESVRLHEDWWGKCRTCRFWNGADEVREREGTTPLVHPRWQDAPCENPRSPTAGLMTTTEGECKQWESYDTDLALNVMYEHDEQRPR